MIEFMAEARCFGRMTLESFFLVLHIIDFMIVKMFTCTKLVCGAEWFALAGRGAAVHAVEEG